MKILVTGGAGFIGSHVVDLYIDKGYDVVIVDDLSTGRLSNLNQKATFYQLDIRSPDLKEIFAIERPDYVNHHAAQMDVRHSVADPMFDCDVNIMGSLNLIECAKMFKVKRIIYISSGGAAYGEPEYLPCDEKHPVNPICQYGASKHTVEHYLYMYHQNYGLEYIVLRYPNVYGPRQDPKGEAGVVAIFTGKMLTGEEVIINGDGEQQRDYVFVADCAQANLIALLSPHSHGIYNLGSGVGTSVNDIFSHLADITSYELKPAHGPAKVGETRHIYLDAKEAQRILNWQPSWSLRDGLIKTVEYFQASKRLEPICVTSASNKQAPQPMLFPSFEALLEASQEADASKYIAAPSSPEEERIASSLQELAGMYRYFEKPMTLSELPERILRVAMDCVEAAGGTVILINDEGEGIEAQYSDAEDTRSLVVKTVAETIEKGLAGWVLETHRAALVENTLEDERWLSRTWEIEEKRARSAISVPLRARSKTFGVLTLVKEETAKYSDDDLAMLSTLATVLNMHSDRIPELIAS